MPIQIISIFCEGPHDVAFIAKILKTMGFVSNESTKLGEYPPPMNQLLTIEATTAQVSDLNLSELRSTLLPSNTLKKDQNYLFLYALGGDKKETERNKLLQNFRSFIPAEGEYAVMPPDTCLSILYFFDADEKGVQKRLSELNKEVEKVLNHQPFTRHHEVVTENGIKLGCFIFTGEDNNTGKLEHILVPLMKAENETIFDNAEQYLKENFVKERIFRLKLSTNKEQGIVEKRIKDSDFDHSKSLIGIVGQLQRSGKANAVHISDTDYLTLQKIKDDTKCQEITTFLNLYFEG